MCLAVPGRVVSFADGAGAARTGTVNFQGSRIEVNLAMTPQAGVGDWVLVHAGFAIAVLDEDDARKTWEYLAEGGMGEMPAELRPLEGS